jgi:hypothetical protein
MVLSFVFKVFIAALAASMPLVRSQDIGWTDSYSIDGKCYCQTSFDHAIGDYMVPGPNGQQITVREACALVGEGPQGDRKYYNDIQCGNGPANDAGDETWCPGRIDMGTGNQAGCKMIGPKWSFPGATPGTVLLRFLASRTQPPQHT